jgi:hypothetical protein
MGSSFEIALSLTHIAIESIRFRLFLAAVLKSVATHFCEPLWAMLSDDLPFSATWSTGDLKILPFSKPSDLTRLIRFPLSNALQS